MNWHNVSRLFHLKWFHNSALNFSVFGTLGPPGPHRGVQIGVNHMSVHFRHHNIEPMANEISKLNFRIWANDCLLAGLCVKNTANIHINLNMIERKANIVLFFRKYKHVWKL